MQNVFAEYIFFIIFINFIYTHYMYVMRFCTVLFVNENNEMVLYKLVIKSIGARIYGCMQWSQVEPTVRSLFAEIK